MFDLLRFVGFLPVRALYLTITLTDINDYFLFRPPLTPPTLGGEINTIASVFLSRRNGG